MINGVRTTLGEFLGNGVTAGEHIRRDSRDAEYVFVGTYGENNGTRVAHLLSYMGTLVEVAVDESDLWTIVRDGSGMPVTADPLTLATARNLIITRGDVKVYREESDRQRSTINRQRGDWELLNELLHEESRDRDWCNVYDQCIDSWNERFSVLQLTPRVHDYEVEVEITATWTVRVPVSGMSDEDAAMEYVSENYDASECLSAAGDSWNTPDNAEIEVQRAEVA